MSGILWRRRWLRVGALLAPPLGWLGVVYLGSLVVLLVAAFWTLDEFSGLIVRGFFARQLPHDRRGAGLPDDRVADAVDRRAGDHHRHRARVPDRVLHGARRDAAA